MKTINTTNTAVIAKSKALSLVEAKKAYETEKVFETEKGFLVNMFGKYQPNVSFIVPKEHELDEKGNAVPYTVFIEDKDITSEMDMEWNGEPEILFGDFWRSKKGGACFRPKAADKAQHILVKVHWGGSYRLGTGRPEGIPGALYFHRSVSNQGALGYDYYVFPVGCKQFVSEEGETLSVSKEFEQAIRDKSALAHKLMPKFNALVAEIEELNGQGGYVCFVPWIKGEYTVKVPGVRELQSLNEKTLKMIEHLRDEYRFRLENGWSRCL